MSASVSSGACVLNTVQLFDFINEQLKHEGKHPIANSAMAARCTLRFNVGKARGVDFSSDTVIIEPGDQELFMGMVEELFEVSVRKYAKKLCVAPEVVTKPHRPADPDPEPAPMPAPEPVEPSEKQAGMVSKIKHMFGRG